MDQESLEDLNVNFKELRNFIEYLETKGQYLASKAGQLAGAYLIFEGIMYIQVLVPSVRKRWIPFCLSGFVSIAFWLTFISSVKNWLRIRGQQDHTFMEQERVRRKMFSIRSGRNLISDAQSSLVKPAFAFERCKRYALVGATYSSLFAFTLLLLFALLDG